MKFIAIMLLLAGIALASPASALEPELASEDMMLKSSDPGIEIYVRNKRRADMSVFRPERTVLYVHGATYPASTTFDLRLDGLSWMDYIAARGYDVYLLDLRGYGKSTRPKQMAEDPRANPPIVRGDTAIRDIATVVNFILARRQIPRLSLIGWSWGTTTTATYTTENPSQVERLVLYAPGWIRQSPTLSGPPAGPGPLGAYRVVTREQAKQRWLSGVPEDKKAGLIPDRWFETWADATWATDLEGAKADPAVIRAPNGVLADAQETSWAGRAYYDPAKITVPTLLVLAEWDHDLPPYMAEALFPLLVNAPDKRLVILAEGTHSIVMEKNRLKLFQTVQAFLDDGNRP